MGQDGRMVVRYRAADGWRVEVVELVPEQTRLAL
jgi:hypothetical protein